MSPEVAHDYEEAHRVYSAMETEDLRLISLALRDDAKQSKHYATRFFAIERLALIVNILADRLTTAKRKTRKLELALEDRKSAGILVKIEEKKKGEP